MQPSAQHSANTKHTAYKSLTSDTRHLQLQENLLGAPDIPKLLLLPASLALHSHLCCGMTVCNHVHPATATTHRLSPPEARVWLLLYDEHHVCCYTPWPLITYSTEAPRGECIKEAELPIKTQTAACLPALIKTASKLPTQLANLVEPPCCITQVDTLPAVLCVRVKVKGCYLPQQRVPSCMWGPCLCQGMVQQYCTHPTPAQAPCTPHP